MKCLPDRRYGTLYLTLKVIAFRHIREGSIQLGEIFPSCVREVSHSDDSCVSSIGRRFWQWLLRKDNNHINAYIHVSSKWDAKSCLCINRHVLCGWRFERPKHITVHVVPREHFFLILILKKRGIGHQQHPPPRSVSFEIHIVTNVSES